MAAARRLRPPQHRGDHSPTPRRRHAGRAARPADRADRRRGGGRVYAGMPSNWGADFTVGAVPVFKYLESRDVDEVGYTLRTASLMTDPEYFFDENDPSDYQLFGIHYLILPSGYRPPVPARPRAARPARTRCGRPATGGYVHVGTDRRRARGEPNDIGVRSIPLLHSRLAQAGRLPPSRVRPGRRLRDAPLPAAAPRARGRQRRLARPTTSNAGEVSTTVTMRRPESSC